MNLHRSPFKPIARSISPLISRGLIGLRLEPLTRAASAYLNYLIGRGNGTGWDLTPEVRAASSLILRKNAIVFDVGANIGKWSKLFREYNSSAFIYQFEPQPSCGNEIAALNIKDSELVRMAVGKSFSTAPFYSARGNDPTASLHQRRDSFLGNCDYCAINVSVIALDDFVVERGIDFIDYLKLDIEGHELSALEGCGRLLSEKRVGCIAFEFGSSNVNSRTYFRDFWELLKPLSFHFFRILPSGRLYSVLEYYEDEEYFRGVSNYIAISESNMEKRSP